MTRPRSTPRKRGLSYEKRARLQRIVDQAKPGTKIISNGVGVCHWCGFRRGGKGHSSCPPESV